MSTVDDLLDFGNVGQTDNSNSNDFGEISWQSSNNTDLLAEFDMSLNKSSDKSHGEFEHGDHAPEGNTDSFLDGSNKEFDDPFASVKLESSDSLLKEFGFDSDLMSGGTSSNPFGDHNPFESEPIADDPAVQTTEILGQAQEEREEEKTFEDERVMEAMEDKEEPEGSDEEGGPQVSSAIDDHVYYQDSSSEEEQNFDTIRPFKPTPAKRPSTSAVTPETHEEEDENVAAGQHDLLEDEEEEAEEEEEHAEPEQVGNRMEEEEEEEEHAEPEQVGNRIEEEEKEEEEEEEEEEEKEEEKTEEAEAELEDPKDKAGDSVNGTGGHENDSNVEAFLNARSRRFEDEDLETADRQDTQDGSGFAYEGHVFQQEKLRDPSPELRESSRYVSDTTAAFDHQPEGGGDEMCRSCGKRVYQMERLIADKNIYHKTCFKCSKCRNTLGVGNFAVNNKELYCKPHFLELFKYRGRYDDNPDAPASNNGHSAPPPVREVRETRVTEEVPAGDVVRADDTVDDGISAVPRLSNLRSRFEAAEPSEQPQREAPPQRPNRQVWKYQQQLKEQQDEEERVRQDEDRRPSHSEARREEELPPQNMARSLAAKFEMDSTDAPMPRQSPRCERRQRDEVEQEREIVREADGNDVLPEVGTTRSLVSVWRNFESKDGRMEVAPPTQRPVVEMTQRQTVAAERSERSPSIGSPSSEQVGEDELPPRDTTRSMAAIFRALESQGGPPPTPDSAMRIQAKAREQSVANSTVRLPNRGQLPPDEAYEAEPPNGHSYAENEPLELDPDVVRNDEPAPTEELPERGTTRNLVAMFKSMEAK